MYWILPIVFVVFIVLIERKILRYIQSRKRPEVNRIFRSSQTLKDRVKLLSKKGSFILRHINNTYFTAILLIFVLTLWLSININFNIFNNDILLLIIFIISTFELVPNLFIRWSSDSDYRILRTLRRVIILICFEVAWLFSLRIILTEYNSIKITDQFYSTVLCFSIICRYIIINILILAEIARTPFDLTERESELVSGFNLEYRSIGFVLIFLREYSIISCIYIIFIILIFFRWIRVILLTIHFLLFCINVIIRATEPRFKHYMMILLAFIEILLIVLLVIVRLIL